MIAMSLALIHPSVILSVSNALASLASEARNVTDVNQDSGTSEEFNWAILGADVSYR